ncbi:hypothetical protein SETIT_2G391100v2 [Setaria italica]|uniref:Uncharacterized protein n=1 Tax=Setaria italica TaxID=4555 RepID=K4A139_SETIT|nr:hypothetical protein SETIT_2G391100v2 [Setaria italica]
MSGLYSLKSDVTRPRPEQSLVRWATPQLHDIDALDQMVDPALQGLYPSKSFSRFADAIALCVHVKIAFSSCSSLIALAPQIKRNLLYRRPKMWTNMTRTHESHSRHHGESGGEYEF